jgi:predicted RNA binding protein YcfA (HicA-like mRNA interferase family)
MTKRAKLFEKLKNNPKDATFPEIENLLLSEDFILDRVAGSHHVFKKGAVTFVIPVHKNRVKGVYVRRIIEIIEGDR